jgi:hypothetical protein
LLRKNAGCVTPSHHLSTVTRITTFSSPEHGLLPAHIGREKGALFYSKAVLAMLVADHADHLGPRHSHLFMLW